MGEARLGTRALNRALLARQGLLERSRLTIPALLERIGGIQNQYAPNAYLRLWSCLEGFRREDLTRAYEDASVVQGTLMRGTIHTVSAADYGPMRAAIGPTQAAWAERLHRTGPVDRGPWLARIRAALADGPLPRTRLLAMLAGAPASVLASVDTDAALLRVPPSGTWDRRRADRCDIAPPGIVDAHGMDEPNALAWLVGRYLAAFGPASVADVASFAGTNVSPIKAVLDRLELRRFRTEDGGELLDVPGGTLPDGETPAPVRFLPTWDASLLVHARRSQVLPDRYRALVFHTKMPPSYPTFLVDGQVAGTWRWEDDEVQLNPFRRLTATERRAVDEEALRLASFHLHGA